MIVTLSEVEMLKKSSTTLRQTQAIFCVDRSRPVPTIKAHPHKSLSIFLIRCPPQLEVLDICNCSSILSLDRSRPVPTIKSHPHKSLSIFLSDAQHFECIGHLKLLINS